MVESVILKKRATESLLARDYSRPTIRQTASIYSNVNLWMCCVNLLYLRVIKFRFSTLRNILAKSGRFKLSTQLKMIPTIILQAIYHFSRGEKSPHPPPKNTFFSHTYLESWSCLEKRSGCSHCENLTESVHSWPSLSAILDFRQIKVGMQNLAYQ